MNPNPRANPAPMRFKDPLEFEDARQALRASAERIRAAEDEIETQITRAAEADAEYHRALARKVISLRTDEESPMRATEAELCARGSEEVSQYAQARDIERDRVKLCFAILEDRRGDRASLHKVVDWSMRAAPEVQQGETFGAKRAS